MQDDAGREDQKPLREFWQFATDFNNIYANIGKLAIAVPFADLVLNIGCPWPTRIGVATFCVLFSMLVLFCSFTIWRQGTTSLKKLKRWLLLSCVAFGVTSLFVYLPLYSIYIVDNPDSWNRIVRGSSYNPAIQRLVDSDPVKWTPRNLLANFEDSTHDEMSIWTPESVYLVRTIVLLVWLLVWMLYAVAVSAFLAIQYRRC